MKKELIKEIVKQTIKQYFTEHHLNLTSAPAKTVYTEMESLLFNRENALPYYDLVDICKAIDGLSNDADKVKLKKYFSKQFGTIQGEEPEDYDTVSLKKSADHLA